MRGGRTVKMNGAHSEFPVSPSSPRLPAEHVLDSGAVIFPGVFDQHGCPLVVFPVESQCKLSEELSAEEVSHFIYYCLRLHSIRVEESLVSVVVDLRQATIAIARFIAETLLFLEVHRRTLHSVYIVQPKKKDVLKQLGKLLTPTGSKQHRPVLFRRIFLKEMFELSNYIDRSQLMSSLGGYLIYCHQSWVAFVKEIDAFVQEFLLVVNRLPSCISTLQSLSKLAVPTDFERLREFCSVNEARFQQLRRDLGLDELLRRGERLLEKLRFPENDPCFHAMAGTLLYTHTAFEMLHNYNRITAAVEKVELLRQQAFSRAHVQLQMASLQRDAQQVEEQMEELMRTKVQPYRTEEVGDAHMADKLRMDFQMSVYTPAMALVRRADDIIHTLAESMPLSERKPAERWLDSLVRLKESLCASVQRLSRSLRVVSDFHHACNRCERWYGLVLGESLLQELLWSGHCEGLGESGCCSSWRRGVESFLRGNPCPEVEELVKLAHLANSITDPQLQFTGTQLSHRCMTLRRILTSPGAIPLRDLQLALQWQYEYLKGHRTTSEDQRDACSPPPDSARPTHASSQCESLSDLSKWPSVGDCHQPLLSAGAVGKPLSLSSFDSGFDGAGSSHLDLRSRREPPRLLGSKPLHGQIHEENIESVSDSEDQCEELGFGLVRDAARASIQIVPKITSDSLNLEIKVKRSATLPKNPWLSLPIDDLESSYTVTITPNSSHLRRSPGPSKHSERPRDLPAQTDAQESFEELNLSLVGNVLSSTLTDHEDKPSRTADGDQSLLWDTFDLHNLRLDESLGDWAQKEQRELSAVEQTLGRAAEIIQEEENVLVQEVVLDELLRSEDLHKHCPVWTEGQQRSVISAIDLAESGVIGFDDPLQNELASLSSDNLNASEVCESDSDVSGLSSERPLRQDTRCPEADGSGIIRELRDLQVLEEQIMEECLKLEELRHTETGVLQSEDHVTTHNSSCERRRFLAQLQEEKREVEKMERSLSREMERAGKARKRSSKGPRVVKCSVMERSSKLRDLDEGLWRNCRLQSPDEAQNTDAESASHAISDTEERSSPNEPLEEVCLTDSSLSSEPLSSSRPDPTMGLSENGIGCPDPPPHSEALQDRPVHGEPLIALSERPEDMDSAAVPLHPSCTNIPDLIHPETVLQCPVERSDVTSPCNCTDGGGCAAGPVEPKVGESSDVQGAFDPGGVSAFPLDGQCCPCPDSEHIGTQAQGASGTSVTTSELNACAQSRSQGLHMQNNNNNTAVVLCSQETQETPCHRDLSLTRRGGAGGGSTRAPCRPTHNQLQIHMRQMSDYKTPIVLDTGSGLMKAGFADQDLPTAVFPTVIGRPKYEEVMNGSVNSDMFIGHDAQHMRGVLTLTYPIRNGVVRSWDEMEMIWRHAFQQLSVAPEDHPVLLTEAALNPLQNRQRMVELMFEAFNVPLTFVAVQAVLALYASGRTTGVVLDSGDGVSHSVPVFEGYCLPHAIQRFNLAGSDVTLQLQKVLLEQGVCMRTSAELEIVREMKEKCCFVALNYEAKLKSAGSEVHYTLPDGRLVSLATERFRAPEILFRPELIGRDHYGMHESVFRSVLQSDIDLRRSFVGNVLLSGGNTLLAGLPERLQQEVRRMVPADLSACVRVTSPQERDFSVWSGGAALANLPDFHSAWISAGEYEEFGPQIVFRKCF